MLSHIYGGGHEIHRAKYLLVSPERIIENGYLRVSAGKIVEIGAVNHTLSNHTNALAQRAEVIDHGEVAMMPFLINAHTHFELSALHSRIPFEGGFNRWVRELLIQREACGQSLLRKQAKQAMEACAKTGTLLVGEISTLGITEDLLERSRLSGICFHEHLGAAPPRENGEFKSDTCRIPNSSETQPTCTFFSDSDAFNPTGIENVVPSVAGHAPHTTSPELLKYLKQSARKKQLPFSIHVAESVDETAFITTAEGGWAAFLKERGIDASDWGLPSRSPVQHLYDLGILDAKTLAVHLINVDDEDMELIAKTECSPVVCPRSNVNLHGKLPDLEKIMGQGGANKKKVLPALGTDSLASTETLNLFDEMAFIVSRFPKIPPSEILAMATINGAEALGYGHIFGTLEEGRIASFLTLPMSQTSDFSSSSKNIQKLILEIITYDK